MEEYEGGGEWKTEVRHQSGESRKRKISLFILGFKHTYDDTHTFFIGGKILAPEL